MPECLALWHCECRNVWHCVIGNAGMSGIVALVSFSGFTECFHYIRLNAGMSGIVALGMPVCLALWHWECRNVWHCGIGNARVAVIETTKYLLTI